MVLFKQVRKERLLRAFKQPTHIYTQERRSLNVHASWAGLTSFDQLDLINDHLTIFRTSWIGLIITKHQTNFNTLVKYGETFQSHQTAMIISDTQMLDSNKHTRRNTYSYINEIRPKRLGSVGQTRLLKQIKSHQWPSNIFHKFRNWFKGKKDRKKK